MFTDEQRAKAAETRRLKAEERQQRKEAAGIPDSRPFGGSEQAEANPVLDCHVGGVKVRELPIEVQNHILYQQTDEGIAEYNEGRSPLRVTTVSDPFDKALQHRRDDVIDRDMGTDYAADPLREVADQHKREGFAQKFLSPRQMTGRGMRGYVPVKDPQTGEPVKVRELVLAEQPEENIRRRQKTNRERGNTLVKEMTKRYLEEGGQTAVADPS